MNEGTVIRSKLMPPPVTWGAISRARLLDLLDQGERRRLTLLIAPAGYGKTTLLAQWVGRQDAGQSAWYTVEETEGHLAAFLTYLTEALAPAIPETADQVRALLAAPRNRLDDVLPHLLNGLGRRKQPLILILDDLHLIADSAEVLKALDRLLRHAPPALRLIFAARQEPPLPTISRLRATGQVLELTQSDLRFLPAEIVALLESTFHFSLDESLAAQMGARTEGWAVALQLACQAGLRHGPTQAERFLQSFGGTTRELYDYLARVVVAGQPAATRAFLRRTAILDCLEVALCDFLLERHDAAAVLASLEQGGLFVFPLDATYSAYRYHALFREFLQRRLLEEEGSKAVRRLHRRAAAWYLEQEDIEQSIAHLLAAGDWEAAADLIYPLQNRLFPTSRYHLMERWLAQFPPSFANTHPWLILSQAKLAALRGERNEAQGLYRRAEPLLRAQGDRAGLHDLYHDLGSLVQDQGGFGAAQGFYTQALEYAENDTQRAVLLGQIARCLYMQGGQVQEALDRLEEAVTLAEQSGSLLGRAGLFSLQGRMRSSVGDLQGALDAYYAALDLLEAFGNQHRQVGLLGNIAYHHCLLGQLDQAEAAARRAVDLARVFDRASGLAYALNVLGEVHRRRGEYDQARVYHLDALARQRQRNEQYEIAATLNWLGVLARYAGDLDGALRRIREGLEIREKLGNDYETGLSLLDLGAVHLSLDHLDEARASWQRAMGIFDAADARYEQTQLCFYLAALAQRRGDEVALSRHLERTFALASAFEWGDPPRCLHFFLEEAAWAAPLLAQALRWDLGGPCPDCLLPQLGRPALEALLPLLGDESARVRARAATLLGRLGSARALKPLARLRRDPEADVRQAVEGAISAVLAAPPPPLRVQCLGRFCLWRGEREITHWGRSAARAVFQYLLAHRAQPVPMERLMDAFWPTSGPAQARKNLHQAVTALRRTLEPELATGMPSRYLRVGEGTYALDLPPGSWVDYEVFEARLRPLLHGESPPQVEALNEALALYRGDYLIENLYEDWAALPRERLRDEYLAGLRLLARLSLQNDQPAAAVAAAARAVEQDPWDEQATLLLMRAYQAQGNLPAALRAYERLRDRLQRDLDLPPDRELTALYNQLRRR